ncbi:tetratricopeptide repeat protein (macronuclear) [Tetrahymena thermophila SB210]|uniref:Tetratricopeptide repeat protein n=1 Tax=Tetrahymena thermophila (strain SB210) TaxID=312017 RepID=I7M984_TETTS|nr:tetratricopeptide repeat protein [Tetrahymena thermophila SB210]EAS01102.1 tetratricopeptide repeat protein [Tetrahymena thermophila SB210]|eukprot:XP_001021347.1 tetratricopeptide repeat protein [Tetrahymena thermophila SB210]
MGSCTSKGVPSSKQNSRKPSKSDFNVQDLMPIHQNYRGQDKQNQQSNNTTIQRIIPPSINDENQSIQMHKNKRHINSQQKYKQENYQPGTQNTHTDCDIQFTSFEVKPQCLPSGTFVGVNNLNDSSHKNILNESQQNIQQNCFNQNENNLNLQIQKQSSFQSGQNKSNKGNAHFQKKIIKDNYLLSKSDKKNQNMSQYLNSLTKKASYQGNNVQEFQLDKVDQDIEEKQFAFSGIGIIKAFHNGNSAKNIVINQNNQPKKDTKTLAQYHQKRIESMFDNLINRTSEKSVDFFDEHANNFIILNTQECKDPAISQRNINFSQSSPYIHAKNNYNNNQEVQLFQGISGLQQNNAINSNTNFLQNARQKGGKPVLTISAIDDISITKVPSQLVNQQNKISFNHLQLNEKDKALLFKYAKNWIYLSRAFQQNGELNDALSCLLPATSLFLQMGLSDYLVIVLVEAYVCFLGILCQRKEEESDSAVKKIEQKFLYIRQTVLSSQHIAASHLIDKQFSGSFINKQTNPILQQEPSQKNTEKTFIFEEWKNYNQQTQNTTLKEVYQNELIFFLEMIYTILKSPTKQFIHILISLIDYIEQCQSSSILYNHPNLNSLYRDLKLLQSKMVQGDSSGQKFENKGMQAIQDVVSQLDQQQINTEQNDLNSFLQSLVNEHSKIILNQFVEESNRYSLIQLNLKIKPIGLVLIKLGHLLRVWLDLSQHALFFYEQAYKYDSNNYEALFYIAITLRNLDKTQEAIQYYNQALEINNYYTECYINLGNIYLQEYQNISVAEKFYVKALISSHCSTAQSSLVCKGRIFNLLGEIQKQNNDYNLASVFYCCGIFKDSLYEENYYDLIDALNCLQFDVSSSIKYFKIIIEVVSFSVFEKSDWQSKLLVYQNQLINILKKSNTTKYDMNYNQLESIVISEDSYQQFLQTFQSQTIQKTQQFIQCLLNKTIALNIKEIEDIYTRKSIQEESSKDDIQYLSILKDFLSKISC